MVSASPITSKELKNVIDKSMSKVGDYLLARISGLSEPRENVSTIISYPHPHMHPLRVQVTLKCE